ncbi:MAG: hypothetical protein RBU37_11180 [Myxococcota bacterium]|jgi:hypothetical protein|nr:hypothetical protein [Myxococcota bacterium]
MNAAARPLKAREIVKLPLFVMLLSVGLLTSCAAQRMAAPGHEPASSVGAKGSAQRQLEQEIFRIRWARRELAVASSASAAPAIRSTPMPNKAESEEARCLPAQDDCAIMVEELQDGAPAPAETLVGDRKVKKQPDDAASGAGAEQLPASKDSAAQAASFDEALAVEERCSRNCELAAAICASSHTICELSQEQVDELEFAAACSWAQQSCEEALELCACACPSAE